MKHFSPALVTLCAMVLLGGCGGGKNGGFGGGAPAVTLSPATLTFASQIVSTTSESQAVTLTNSGSVPLNITSIAASDNYAADSTACATTLAVGANCIIDVTFSPGAVGTLTGTITFTDDATNSPQTVALAGTGS